MTVLEEVEFLVGCGVKEGVMGEDFVEEMAAIGAAVDG